MVPDYEKQEGCVYLSGRTVFFDDQDYVLRWRLRGRPADGSAFCLEVIQGRGVVIRQVFPPPIRVSDGALLETSLRYPKIRECLRIQGCIRVYPLAEGSCSDPLFYQPVVWVSREWKGDFGHESMRNQLGTVGVDSGSGLWQVLLDMGLQPVQVGDLASFPGRWLICSGQSLHRDTSLFERLLDRAERGADILVLPPFSGSIPLPGFRPRMRFATQDACPFSPLPPWGKGRSAGGIAFGIFSGESAALRFDDEGKGYAWAEWCFQRGVMYLGTGVAVGEDGSDPSARMLINDWICHEEGGCHVRE